MATGETIKGLFSLEMSSIPQGWRGRRWSRGRRRRTRSKRRGLENGALGRLAGQRIVLADMCRYRSVLMAHRSPENS